MSAPLPETLPAKMTAIEITEPGGPKVLRAVARPVPTPERGEVLIKVAAAGVNRPDVLQRMGAYPPPEGASDLPGLEVSGTVVALGDGVDDLPVGTPVCALLPGGGYAEYAIAHAGLCLPVPDGVDVVDAASLPEVYFTVWANVYEDAGLTTDETLLVHGGSSGIGSAATMLAKATGARVIATASTDEKRAACRDYGADTAIDYTDATWPDQVLAACNGGVDVVLDMAGGDFVAKNLDCLRPGGRHVSIAFLRGAEAAINIMAIMRKRLTLSGSTLRARTIEEKARLAQNLRDHVWPFFEGGALRPVVSHRFPLTDAATAHQTMEDGAHLGKIILTTE